MNLKNIFTPKEFSTLLFITIFGIIGYSYKIYAQPREEEKKQERKINNLVEQNKNIKKELNEKAQAEKDKQIKKININTANEKELSQIRGIGPRKAQAIIEFRETHGNFKNTKELAKVKGIGTATLKRIEKYISVK